MTPDSFGVVLADTDSGSALTNIILDDDTDKTEAYAYPAGGPRPAPGTRGEGSALRRLWARSAWQSVGLHIGSIALDGPRANGVRALEVEKPHPGIEGKQRNP